MGVINYPQTYFFSCRFLFLDLRNPGLERRLKGDERSRRTRRMDGLARILGVRAVVPSDPTNLFSRREFGIKHTSLQKRRYRWDSSTPFPPPPPHLLPLPKFQPHPHPLLPRLHRTLKITFPFQSPPPQTRARVVGRSTAPHRTARSCTALPALRINPAPRQTRILINALGSSSLRFLTPPHNHYTFPTPPF